MLNRKLTTFFMLLMALFSFNAYASSISKVLDQSSDPVAGNPRGNVAVAEFFDYQCSHCIKMSPVVNALIAQNPDVRFVFKDFPVLGPTSVYAAKAALAAKMQGKYLKMHDQLMAANGRLSDAKINAIAEHIGLDMKQFKKDIDSKQVASMLSATKSLAKELGIRGTPAFYIGPTKAKKMSDVMFTLGEMSQSAMQTAIDQVTKEAS